MRKVRTHFEIGVLTQLDPILQCLTLPYRVFIAVSAVSD